MTADNTSQPATAASSETPDRVSTVRFALETGLAAEIATVAEPVLEDLGFRLVRVLVSGTADRIVQIMAERPDGTINVDDCEKISDGLSPVLDVADPMSGKYRLEISSPGIDRPLVRPSDFEDWSGHDARIELKEPVDGRKRYKGKLEGFEDGEVRMAADAGSLGILHVGFPLALVAEAKLVLTDDLIREALARAKERHSGREADARPGDGAELDAGDLEEATLKKPKAKKAARPGDALKKPTQPKNTPSD